MNRRKEPCRNFQRGSCQYGERCKFLHVIQQQSKPNPFGFGTHNGSQSLHTNLPQQQKQNPFGFGVQNTQTKGGFGTQNGSQSLHTNLPQQQKQNPFGFGEQNTQTKGGSDFGSKYQNQVKPFENKWSRVPSTASGTSAPSRQSDNQPQAVNHTCTDPEACKRQIIEDLEHERPLWKLTCYGHSKNRPCDIFGDVSYEELRAAAYGDARQGLSSQSIVERERNLLNSKLMEFEKLLQNPYATPVNPSSSRQSPFPGSNLSPSSFGVQSAAPPVLSSFSQLGSSINLGSTNSTFPPPTGAFGQTSPYPVSAASSGAFGMSSSPFGTLGSFGAQQPMQPFGRAPISNAQNFNTGILSAASNSFSSPSVASTNFSISQKNTPPQSVFNASNFSANGVAQASVGVHSSDNKEVSKDTEIWLKAAWKRGEIPEEAPPDAFT